MIARVPYFPPIEPELRRLFSAEGLTLVGIADPEPSETGREEYDRFIAAGHAGSMGYLARHADAKYAPERLLPGVRSILFGAINYFQRTNRRAGRGEGRIARYAWGRDYHKVMGARLRRVARALGERYPEETFRPYSDATPLAERHYAERAGIGFTGRHTLLISGQYGSWFLLGEVLSTRRFEASGPAGRRHGGCPSSCRKCIDVCPTGALLGPHRIDASRCISYLTIEHRGSIPPELRPKIGNWLFGCDLCQEVCPLNLREQPTDVADFRRVNAGETQELASILAIENEEQFAKRFAGSPLMRAKRSGLVRNACIVAANNGARELLPVLRRLSGDRDPVVAEHAAWAVSRLSDERRGASRAADTRSSGADRPR